MFSDAQCTGIDAEARGDFGSLEVVHVQHTQELAIIVIELFHRATHRLGASFVDEVDQRIVVRCARRAAGKSDERAFLPARRAAVMHADVPRGLKNERRKRFEFLDFVLPQRFDDAAQRLLRDIFGSRSIAEAARGENAEAFPVPLVELSGDLFRTAAP